MTNLALGARPFDDALLNERDLFQSQLHAQIAASHHDAFAFVQNLLQVLPALRFLDLGDHRNLRVVLLQVQLHPLQIARPAHERERHEIDARLQAALQILHVFAGERGRAQLHPGQVDALVVAYGSADDHHAPRRYGVGVEHLELDASVGQEHAIAGLDVLCEMRIAGGCQRGGAQHFLGGDAEGIARE